jgi:hypothetical protein
MNRFYNTLAALAVILTPVAMMTAFGWTTYAEILKQTGVPWLALLSGLAAAAALETIGIVAGETTLWFHGRHDRRWLASAAVLLIYVAFSLHALRGTPLALLPLLAGAVYILVGLRAQAQRETAAADTHAAADRAWEQEKWRIEQDDRTRVRLAKVEVLAQSQHSAPPASTQPAQSEPSHRTSGHQCEDCGRTFATVHAINAHRRFCPGTPPAAPTDLAIRSNGHV